MRSNAQNDASYLTCAGEDATLRPPALPRISMALSALLAGARNRRLFATFKLAHLCADGRMAMELIRRSLTSLGVVTAHPLAFLMVAIYGLLWLLLDRQNFGWHGFAVLATWFMTLLIQRAEHRDTQAIHAKLDELLSANETARTELSELDQEEPEEIERKREKTKR